MTTLTPFEVRVDDAVLADLRARLANTRWPGGIDGAGWHYGAPQDEVRRLCDAWIEFDWRAAEARINASPQFTTELDGEQVHLLHVRSPHPGAVPLLLTHGWPGSIAEFLDVIGPLVDPPAHGGDAADAFHVVVPAIPGYGFSGPTRSRGVHVRRVAEMWAELMARLGYDRYVAQGGDWGAMITSHLALVDPDHVERIHLNLVVAPPEEDQLADLTDDEQVRLKRPELPQQPGELPRLVAEDADLGHLRQPVEDAGDRRVAGKARDRRTGAAGELPHHRLGHERVAHACQHRDGGLHVRARSRHIGATLRNPPVQP